MSDVAKWFSVFIFLLSNLQKCPKLVLYSTNLFLIWLSSLCAVAFSFSSFILNLDTYVRNHWKPALSNLRVCLLCMIFIYTVYIYNTSTHILQLQSGDLVERQDQNVINHMLKYFYAALGDFENASLGDINSTPFTKSVQVAYVLLNNLLMVNLIITMMGNCSSLSPPRPLLPRPRPALSPSAPYFYCLCVVNVTNCAW